MPQVWMHRKTGYLAIVVPCYTKIMTDDYHCYEMVGLLFENEHGVIFLVPDTEEFKSNFEVLGEF